MYCTCVGTPKLLFSKGHFILVNTKYIYFWQFSHVKNKLFMERKSLQRHFINSDCNIYYIRVCMWHSIYSYFDIWRLKTIFFFNLTWKGYFINRVLICSTYTLLIIRNSRHRCFWILSTLAIKIVFFYVMCLLMYMYNIQNFEIN